MLPSKPYKASKITRSNVKNSNAPAKLHTHLLLRSALPDKFRRSRPPQSHHCPYENSPARRTTQICLRANTKIAHPNPENPRRDLANLAQKFRISYCCDLRNFSLSSITNAFRNSLSVCMACIRSRSRNPTPSQFTATSVPRFVAANCFVV